MVQFMKSEDKMGIERITQERFINWNSDDKKVKNENQKYYK